MIDLSHLSFAFFVAVSDLLDTGADAFCDMGGAAETDVELPPDELSFFCSWPFTRRTSRWLLQALATANQRGQHNPASTGQFYTRT